MKTLIKSFALALTLAATTVSATFADGTPAGRTANAAAFKSGVYTNAAGKLHVSLDKETGGKVTIRLKDNNGTILYNEQLGKNETTYRTRMDLSDLPDGTYELELTNGVETTRQTVTISTRHARLVQTQLVAAK